MSPANDILKAFWDAIKTWLAVTVCLIIIAVMISVVVRDNVRKTINEQLVELRIQTEVIKNQTKALEEQAKVTKEQNAGSATDRAHINMELSNTRGSLERLEKAVKTEIMKP